MFDKHEYRSAAVQLARGIAAAQIVEVGVWRGDLTGQLVKLPSMERMILVDPWDVDHRKGACGQRPSQEEFDAMYRSAVDRFAGERVEILRQASPEAADAVPDRWADYVHLDANQSLKQVRDDIAAWLPKVRVGGILCGGMGHLWDVRKALEEVLPDAEIAGGVLWHIEVTL